MIWKGPSLKFLVAATALLFLIELTNHGSALKCYQCVSIESAPMEACKAGDESKMNLVDCAPGTTNCILYEAETEISRQGYWPSKFAYQRNCSSSPLVPAEFGSLLRNNMRCKKSASESGDVVAFNCLCNTDGCNSADHAFRVNPCGVFLMVIVSFWIRM